MLAVAHDVFISHSTKDKAVGDAVCATLEAAKIRCWIGPRDVQPGLEFPGQITRAIRECKVMVLIFSTHSNASSDVLREVRLAAAEHHHVLQFKIENAAPNDDLKYFLSAPHWLDALTPPLERHLERLVPAIKALIALQDEDSHHLPSHLPSTEVELADATLFSATLVLSKTLAPKSEFFEKLRPLLAPFLGEKTGDVIASMDERETISSTGGGFGLGFPHGYRPYIKRFVAGILRIPDGCDWHAADDKPVFTVLLYVGGGQYLGMKDFMNRGAG
jgi:mannitol/fructose-specific phosphotransferase system IIA component